MINEDLNREQEDDLKEWVIFGMILSVLSIVISALSWIFR